MEESYSCGTCQGIKGHCKHRSKLSGKDLDDQASTEYEEISAVEEKVVAKPIAIRAAPAGEEPYEILRETPMYLTPIQPVLNLRPTAYTEEAESIQITNEVGQAKQSKYKLKRKAHRGFRGLKKRRWNKTTSQASESSSVEFSTLSHEAKLKEQEQSTKARSQGDEDDLQYVQVEAVGAEAEDEDGGWRDEETETEEEYYAALEVHDDFELM